MRELAVGTGVRGISRERWAFKRCEGATWTGYTDEASDKTLSLLGRT